MNLTPVAKTTEPTYPTYRGFSSKWRKLAAAVAASAALWLPACSEDTTRLSGEPPIPEATQIPQPQPDVKPPELPVVDEPVPPPRLAGIAPQLEPPSQVKPPEPPVEPEPIRLAGRAMPPRHPR